MNNEPVAWFYPNGSPDQCTTNKEYAEMNPPWTPLYTHPAKELHLSLQKSKETGELLAVTYTDDEHRIVEVLWKKPPAKTLTDEIEYLKNELMMEEESYMLLNESFLFAKESIKQQQIKIKELETKTLTDEEIDAVWFSYKGDIKDFVKAILRKAQDK